MTLAQLPRVMMHIGNFETGKARDKMWNDSMHPSICMRIGQFSCPKSQTYWLFSFCWRTNGSPGSSYRKQENQGNHRFGLKPVPLSIRVIAMTQARDACIWDGWVGSARLSEPLGCSLCRVIWGCWLCIAGSYPCWSHESYEKWIEIRGCDGDNTSHCSVLMDQPRQGNLGQSAWTSFTLGTFIQKAMTAHGKRVSSF